MAQLATSSELPLSKASNVHREIRALTQFPSPQLRCRGFSIEVDLTDSNQLHDILAPMPAPRDKESLHTRIHEESLPSRRLRIFLLDTPEGYYRSCDLYADRFRKIAFIETSPWRDIAQLDPAYTLVEHTRLLRNIFEILLKVATCCYYLNHLDDALRICDRAASVVHSEMTTNEWKIHALRAKIETEIGDLDLARLSLELARRSSGSGLDIQDPFDLDDVQENLRRKGNGELLIDGPVALRTGERQRYLFEKKKNQETSSEAEGINQREDERVAGGLASGTIESRMPRVHLTWGDRHLESIQTVHHSFEKYVNEAKNWGSHSEELRVGVVERFDAEKDRLDFVPLIGRQFHHVHECVYVSSFPHSVDEIKTMHHFFGIRHFLNVNMGSFNGVRIVSPCDVRSLGKGFECTTLEPDSGIVELVEKLGITLHHVPLYDGRPGRLGEQQMTTKIIQSCVHAGEPILVHCMAGKGRSWTAAMLWYTRTVLRFDPKTADRLTFLKVFADVNERSIGARFRSLEKVALFSDSTVSHTILSPDEETQKLRDELFDFMYFGFLAPCVKAEDARIRRSKSVTPSGRGILPCNPIANVYLRDCHVVEPKLMTPTERGYRLYGAVRFDLKERVPLSPEQRETLFQEPKRVMRAKLRLCDFFPTVDSIIQDARDRKVAVIENAGYGHSVEFRLRVFKIYFKLILSLVQERRGELMT